MSFDRRILLRSNAKTVSIPLEQGNVFRQNILGKSAKEIESQSLWSRAMSFDINFKHFRKRNWSQSLWSRAMSFDAYAMRAELSAIQSQSLWNRAMSFDGKDFIKKWFTLEVSIPLEQGNVFRHPYKGLFISRILSQSLWNRAMSFDRGIR